MKLTSRTHFEYFFQVCLLGSGLFAAIVTCSDHPDRSGPTNFWRHSIDEVGTEYKGYWDEIDTVTGLGSLHEKGFYGQNEIIAIIDGGFQIDHEAFCRPIADTFNFLRDDDDVVLPPRKSQQFLANHGTATSLAAVGCSDVLLGPAPHARSALYKASAIEPDPDASSLFEISNPTDLKALLRRCVQNHVSVITISIGRQENFGSNPVADTFDKAIRDNNLIAFSSTTNSADVGPSQLSSMALGREVVSVGNYMPGFEHGYEILVETANRADQWSRRRRIILSKANLGTPGLDEFRLRLFQHQLPAQEHETSGKASLDLCDWIASTDRQLFQEEELLLAYVSNPLSKLLCPGYENNLKDLLSRGVPGIILYTTKENEVMATRPDMDQHPKKPAGWLKGEHDVQYLLGVIGDRGNEVRVKFPARPIIKAVPNSRNPHAGLHPSSGFGPTYDLGLRPMILAPGTELLTGFHTDDGYRSVTGTSIAAPFAAGAAAAIAAGLKAANPLTTLCYKRLRARIITSGRPVLRMAAAHQNAEMTMVSKEIPYEPVWSQGSGLFNASTALYSDLEFWPPTIELNDTEFMTRTHEIHLTNSGDQLLEVWVKNLPSPGRLLMGNILGEGFAPIFVQPVSEHYPLDMSLQADVDFSNYLTIQPGRTVVLNITFTPPRIHPWQVDKLPVYGGWLEFETSLGHYHHVPYLGCAGTMRSIRVIRNTPYFTWNDKEMTAILPWIPLTIIPSIRMEKYFMLPVDLSIGSRIVRLDYVDQNWSQERRRWSYPPVRGRGGYHGTPYGGVKEFAERSQRAGILKVQSVFADVILDGRLEDGTEMLKAGVYRVRVMALKVFGNPDLEEDWEMFVASNVINLWGAVSNWMDDAELWN